MLLNLMYFLLVLFQSFHTGGAQITAHTYKEALCVSGVQQLAHKTHTAKTFTTIIGIEETEDTDNSSADAINTGILIPASNSFLNTPAPLMSIGHSGVPPSSLFGKRLFVLHHNFRV